MQSKKNIFKDFLQVDTKEKMTMIKLSKMKSINPQYIEDMNNNFLNLENKQNLNSTRRMIRSYENIETIKRSKIKPF